MKSLKKKILIAEDERPLAKALELKLSKLGYECSVVYDGEQALARLAEERFDLLITDIMMPKKNGFEVIEEKPELNATIPTIIASNLGQQEDKDRAKALGVDRYFVKSDTPLSVLIGYVEDILAKK